MVLWCLTEVSVKISWMVSNLSAYSDVPPPMRFKYNSGAHSAKEKQIKIKMKFRDSQNNNRIDSLYKESFSKRKWKWLHMRGFFIIISFISLKCNSLQYDQILCLNPNSSQKKHLHWLVFLFFSILDCNCY